MIDSTRHLNPPAGNSIVPVLILWGIVAFGSLGLIISQSITVAPDSRTYLIPWVIAFGVVLAIPVVYLFYRGKFDMFHPLVLPVWIYFLPGYIVGGFILSLGYAEPYYLAFIGDETYNLPLTFLYLIVGFASLILGFSFPFSRHLGRKLGNRLPSWEIPNALVIKAGTVLMILGSLNMLFALYYGVFGYQIRGEESDFGGTISMFTLFWYQGAFLVSLGVFRARTRTWWHYSLLALVFFLAVLSAVINGSRGGFVHLLLPIFAAFLYSGRNIRLRTYFTVSSLIVLLLLIGIIYGTAFRSVKGNEQAVGFTEYIANIPRTVGAIGKEDFSKTLDEGMQTLALRLELVSSLGVVVANYEALQTYEDQYGIENNILVETFTFFVPRVIWREKPVAIQPRKYSELYFDFADNSFTMTPIGDLLRNFGPIGVPIGMLILGSVLGFVYNFFIDGQNFSYWKISTYYLLIATVSYDGFYGSIIPHMLKVLFIAVIGLLIMRALVGRSAPFWENSAKA